ncbi:glucosamine-6-phosphate deaminase [Arthrobacter sp. ov407]|uniref:glucosamine-6-phosphate deaminase n=1 Tax=Arthrobacter sp. ov407 TaxID=1761748 RepID=UPI000B839595
MKIIQTGTSAQAGIRGARIVAALIREKPDAVLGLATGSSPLPLYEALGGEPLDLSEMRGFSLDEYLGLGSTHKHSYAQVIRREVIHRLGLTPARIHSPDGQTADAALEASEFEARIRAAGGVDIQILGIGSNGHLAFNEPPSAFTSRTRVVELADSTRTDNARFFDSLEDVPTHAITQGLGTISEARHLLLIAHGHRKAEAAALAIEGPVTEQFPASMIQLHPKVTVILDEAAASRLQRV